MIYGYARVSAPGQDHAAQVAELKAAGCGPVFAETLSAAAGRKRPQLARAIAALQPGDVLMVTRLNRLARSSADGLRTIAAVAVKGAEFRSLREAWADTTTPAGRLMVAIWLGFAEFDREMILERTSEGRAIAKARGVKLGRRPTLTAMQADFVRQARTAEPPTHSIGELRSLLDVSRSTITRAARGAAGGGPRQIDLEAAIAERQKDLN